MRILFVTSIYPENIEACTYGIYQRMTMFMEALNGFADLDILFYVGPNVDVSPDRAVRMEKLLAKHWNCEARVFLCRSSGNSTVSLPASFPFGGRLKEWWFLHRYFYEVAGPEHVAALDNCLQSKPDAVFVHRLNSMYPVLSSRKVTQPVFFDLDDIEHRLFSQSLKSPPFWRSKFLQYLKVPSLVLLERRSIALARKTFVCSEIDRSYLSKTLRMPGVATIPNAIEIPPLPRSSENPVFLLLGNYSFAPNVVAADRLVRKIWPIVKSEIPEAKLMIAGKNPENIPCYGKQDGVEFRGFVEDLTPLYRETRVVCCPIESGSGTRVKIIEAAAHGKAIVSTALGAEGLDFVDGQEILLRDDPVDFAQGCIELIKDKPRALRMGEAARAKAMALYDRNDIINRIRSEISAELR
jgi:glycosyltransferase involved in cell wall biosynthesis